MRTSKTLRVTSRVTLSIFCLLVPELLLANSENTWSCTAKDIDKKTWSVTHMYQKPAMTIALSACKKQSRMPTSCKLKESDCELLVNGISTKPIWQCEALDETGVPFEGKLNPDRDTAALSAKANCKENSSVPDSCYIYPFTCTNLQEQK